MNNLSTMPLDESDINYVDIKEVLNITVAYLDGEPTTADESNVVYISDVNKEIAKEWKNKE